MDLFLVFIFWGYFCVMGMGLFRILGPVMVGPSSSHTAGAVRIGLVARSVAKGEISKVKFYLHGSFRNTYKGHGTDRALTAGILGFKTNDERIIDALDIAKKECIELEFIKSDLGSVHPNTVKIEVFNKQNEKSSIMGSSIGGGGIKIIEINGIRVNTSCNYDTVIIKHEKETLIICKILNLIENSNTDLISLRINQCANENRQITILEINNIEDSSKSLFFSQLASISGVLDITNIEKI